MIFFHASSTSAALSCIGLALVQHAGDAILNAKSAPECAQALQSMFYENASPEKVIENAFYRDWNIDEIKRSLSSQSIRAAVNKKRKCITAPHTSRKHTYYESTHFTKALPSRKHLLHESTYFSKAHTSQQHTFPESTHIQWQIIIKYCFFENARFQYFLK